MAADTCFIRLDALACGSWAREAWLQMCVSLAWMPSLVAPVLGDALLQMCLLRLDAFAGAGVGHGCWGSWCLWKLCLAGFKLGLARFRLGLMCFL